VSLWYSNCLNQLELLQAPRVKNVWFTPTYVTYVKTTRRYATGLSITAVSDELKVGRDVVYGEITRRGIARPRNGAD
jgi:hypothetical protein